MNDDTIQLAHGGGGRLSRELIDAEIVSRFGGGPLRGLPDAATLPRSGRRHGLHDRQLRRPAPRVPGRQHRAPGRARHGQRYRRLRRQPAWLSLGLILEEGLPLATLRRVLDAVRDRGGRLRRHRRNRRHQGRRPGTVRRALHQHRGHRRSPAGLRSGARANSQGDHVLVSGPLGDHGMAVLAAAKASTSGTGPTSDTGPVHRLVLAAQEFAADVRFMRDPTRGGLAAVLNEIVEEQPVGILLRESDIPALARRARRLPKCWGWTRCTWPPKDA